MAIDERTATRHRSRRFKPFGAIERRSRCSPRARVGRPERPPGFWHALQNQIAAMLWAITPSRWDARSLAAADVGDQVGHGRSPTGPPPAGRIGKRQQAAV